MNILAASRHILSGFGVCVAAISLVECEAYAQARVDLGCSKVDSVRRPLCEFSEALLNNDCKRLGDELFSVDCGYSAYQTPDSKLRTLQRICDADWIPQVAAECDARASRLDSRSQDQLATYRREKARLHNLERIAAAKKAAPSDGVVRDCIYGQAAKLAVTSEPADAVASAAISLCSDGLRKVILPRCIDNPSSCREIERHAISAMVPRVAAHVMQLRAEAAQQQAKGKVPGSGKGNRFGTAFFVASDGMVLTNAHVVDNCQRIDVGSGGKQGTAQIVARDDRNDLALVATSLRPIATSKWRLSMRQGEEVIVYGFPLSGVLASDGNVTIGNVTALAGLLNDSRFLQISAPIQPGNSGGPLLDKSGNIVGVVVSKLDAVGMASSTGDIPQNVNFAIKASVAAAFLDAQHVVYEEGNKGNILATPDLTERAKAQTLQVICVR